MKFNNPHILLLCSIYASILWYMVGIFIAELYSLHNYKNTKKCFIITILLGPIAIFLRLSYIVTKYTLKFLMYLRRKFKV